MSIRPAVLILGFWVVAIPLASHAQAKELHPCPPRWGQPGAPLVPDEETARRIYLAVEDSFNPGADRKGFPEVKADDEGDCWEVFRWKPPIQTPNGWLVTEGGGQLEMGIAKCDAAISNLHYSR